MTEWNGTNTEDRLTIEKVDDNKSVVTLNCIEKVDDNMALVVKLTCAARDEGIEWLGLQFSGRFELIDGADFLKETYRPGSVRTIYCEVNRFVDFYKKNLQYIVTAGKMHIRDVIQDDDGWTMVTNKRKLKRQQAQQLHDEIKLISSSWGSY